MSSPFLSTETFPTPLTPPVTSTHSKWRFKTSANFIRVNKILNSLLFNWEILLHSDWTVRIYSDLNSKLLGYIFNDYPFVDLCNVTQVVKIHNITRRPLFQMTWRFLPLLDPLVDGFLSRDTDTIISSREVAAVNQWINNSTATFHLMRDHPHHCSVRILGGIFV